MRVYYFCPETGIYQGEDFHDGSCLKDAEGVTDIAPPPYCPGEVPVFDISVHAWTIKRIASLHPEQAMAAC